MKKRSQNAQPQNEILRLKGAWGRCSQQASLWLWICLLYTSDYFGALPQYDFGAVLTGIEFNF